MWAKLLRRKTQRILRFIILFSILRQLPTQFILAKHKKYWHVLFVARALLIYRYKKKINALLRCVISWLVQKWVLIYILVFIPFQRLQQMLLLPISIVLLYQYVNRKLLLHKYFLWISTIFSNYLFYDLMNYQWWTKLSFNKLLIFYGSYQHNSNNDKGSPHQVSLFIEYTHLIQVTL